MYSRTINIPWFARGIQAWQLGFYTYFFLVNISFGMYLTVSRDMVNTLLGHQYSFMTLLVAAENIPLIFSVVGGGLGDVIGRRTVFLIGFLSTIPLILMGYLPLEYLPLMAGLYMFFWSLAQPSVTGALLHATSSSGIHYSLFAMSGTIGWGVGGPLAGIIITGYGWWGAWITTAAINLLGYIIAYIFFPRHVIGGGVHGRELVEALECVYIYVIAAILGVSGFLLFFGNYALVLRSRISDPGLFGLFYTFIPAILGLISRPILGYLSEKIDPRILALTGTVTYTFVITGLYLSTGVLMLILWALPIYPLIDQGFMLTFSKKLRGELQSFASGLWSSMFSIGGLIVLLIGFTWITSSFTHIYMCSATLLTASSILLLIIMYKLEQNDLSYY
jgi:hypothetical protein